MKIGEIIEKNQPHIHKILFKKKHRKKKINKQITFAECENLMRHDSYARHSGAIRQVRHG